MGRQRWNQKAKDLLSFASPIEVFHLFTLTILSLLLPTSFLLLVRLSAFHHYSLETTTSFLHLYSLLLRFNPNALYLLVSIVSVATLIHGLTSKFAFFSPSSSTSSQTSSSCLVDSSLFFSNLRWLRHRRKHSDGCL